LEHMQMFEFEILHTPGETNQLADALSRLYENDDIKEVPKEEFLDEHLKGEDFASDEDFHHHTTHKPTSSLHVEPSSSFYNFKPISLFKPTSFAINAMPSNGTSSNACDAGMHWTACRSKDGCPFHYSSTIMETHSAFAPHYDNNYPQFSGGADNNNGWDASYDSDDENYPGPWYGPYDECPNPEDNPVENYAWLVDNRYLLPTEPGQILEENPKQYDSASGEQRPKFPAELYAPDGPWWHQARQLPSGPHIPGLLSTETTYGSGPANTLRLETVVQDVILQSRIENEGINFEQQTAAGSNGSTDGEAGNADTRLIQLCDAAEAKVSSIPGGYDQLVTDEYSEIPEWSLETSNNNQIDEGKGKEKYNPRERLPMFLVGTPLGETVLPAIIRGYQTDPMAQNGVRRPFSGHDKYIILDDPSCTENFRLYIPEVRIDDNDPATDLRTKIVKSSHLLVGHQGADKSYMHCRKYFYWPNMRKDFDDYVNGCMTCQRNKDATGKPIGDPKIMDIPVKPWESIAIDLLGPFNVSNGYQNIMVIMDRFSSAIILAPLKGKYTTRDAANVFLTKVYSTYGLPASIVSDRDPRFTSKFWQGLHNQLGIELLMSTSFHQNTNGQVERANRTIGQILRIFTDNNQNDWAHHLWRVEHAFNNSPTSTMGKTPNEIQYGHVPREIPAGSASNVPAVNEYLEEQEIDNAVARDSLLAARYRQATTAAHRRNPKNPFKIGQLAFYRKMIRDKGKVRKLTTISEGPYEITDINDFTENCTLKLPKDSRIHPVFAPDRLKPFRGQLNEKLPPTPPTEIDQEERLYDVKEILDHKRENRKDFWYVSWLGYGPEDNSWEPDEYVRDGAADAIYEYLTTFAREAPPQTKTALCMPDWFYWPTPIKSFSSFIKPESESSSDDEFWPSTSDSSFGSDSE
jgi:hypothetical protein